MNTREFIGRAAVSFACGALSMLAVPRAHAQSWFQFEAGLGGQVSRSMGDGTWHQQGTAGDKLQMSSPAYLAGFTGDHGNWQYHVDYVYFGQMSASCTCVLDAEYNPHTHTASVPGYIPFNGFGHTQGIAATIGYGLTHGTWRYGIEAGPWVYWATWHESHDDPAQPGAYDLSHRTVPQLGWVAGVRVERGPYSLSYRFYSAQDRWNPNPGMVLGTHMFMLNYKF